MVLRNIKKVPVELLVWVTGLLFVSLIPPHQFSICLFHHFGFKYCPGCGLGHAIYYLVHGNWQQSFDTNPLAVLAIVILIHRIIKLAYQLKPQKIKSTV